METLGEINAAGQNLIKDALSLRSDIDTSIRSFRNKAITDAITAGYEAQQEILSLKNEAQEMIRSKTEEAVESFETARKEILESFERYM